MCFDKNYTFQCLFLFSRCSIFNDQVLTSCKLSYYTTMFLNCQELFLTFFDFFQFYSFCLIYYHIFYITFKQIGDIIIKIDLPKWRTTAPTPELLL